MREKIVCGYSIVVEEILPPNPIFGRRQFMVTMRAARKFDGGGSGWASYRLLGQNPERSHGGGHTLPPAIEKEMKKWAAAILRDREGRENGLSKKGRRDDRHYRARARQEDASRQALDEAGEDGFRVRA
jgi:hypothetical protein